MDWQVHKEAATATAKAAAKFLLVMAAVVAVLWGIVWSIEAYGPVAPVIGILPIGLIWIGVAEYRYHYRRAKRRRDSGGLSG